jgi:hypothetical protein
MGHVALKNLGRKWDCLEDVEGIDGSLDRTIPEKDVVISEVEQINNQLDY